MRRYAKFRPLVMLALVVAIFAGTTAFGANEAANGEGATPAHVNGPFGLLINQMKKGDLVGWTVVLLSIIGVTVIIQAFIRARAAVMFPPAATDHIRDLIQQRQFKELIEFTETDPSFVSKALNPALKRAPSFAAMKEAMETAIGEQSADEFRRIEYLNIIGNLGPLLGLLGTVMGMVEAFGQMQAQKGAADPSVLSGGIAMALAHTFAGLVLALPCLAAFGVLRTMVDRLTVRGALIAEELLLMVKPAEAKPAATAATGGARPGIAPMPAPAAAPKKAPGAAPTVPNM